MRVTAPAGDPRLFVVEQQTGLVKVVDAGGAILPQPFLDLRNQIAIDHNERGLLSIAFAPDYGTSGLLYAYLTPPGKVEVREYRRTAADANRAEATGRTVFTADHPRGNHNGGLVVAGPDGALWFATGDGGGANDPDRNAQNPSSPLGKMLRFSGSGAPEVVAAGLRNPWRFSFDRGTGDLVIGDVGQGEREEVDFAAAPGRGAGANWGWPCWEGTTRTPGVVCEAPGHTPPVHELLHDGGACSITGGVVVRDPGVPSLAGRYLYGDICLPELRTITLPTARDDRVESALRVAQVTDVAEDGCSRVLVSSLTGGVFRLVEGAPSACDAPSTAPPASPPACGLSVRALRARRAVVLRSGLAVRVSVRSACRVAATARIAGVGTLVARGRNLVAGQRVTLRLRAGARTRSRLRRRGSVVAAVTVTGGSERVTARVRIRR